MDVELEGVLIYENGREPAIDIEECIGTIKAPLLRVKIGMNAGADGLDDNFTSTEVVLFKDIYVRVNLDVVRSIVPSRQKLQY